MDDSIPTLAGFVRDEVLPHLVRWEAEGAVPRAVWRRAGELGLLCAAVPPRLGGRGLGLRASFALTEAFARLGICGLGFDVHSDICASYLLAHGTAAQQEADLPAMCRGETIAALALTEPQAGTDLQALSTRAEAEGEGFRLSGRKAHITNAAIADLFIVAARTVAAGKPGLSLFLVRADDPGVSRPPAPALIGRRASATGPLELDGVRLGRDRLLGGLNGAWPVLGGQLASERLLAAASALAAAEGVLAAARAHARARPMFGARLADLQHWRFRLADLHSGNAVGRAYVEQGLAALEAGRLGPDEAAIAKYWLSEHLSKVLDTALQLMGAAGYLADSHVGRAYVDFRAHRLLGGGSEIMLELIARGQDRAGGA